MKKSKTAMLIAGAFITAISLASCSGVQQNNDGYILTYQGTHYTADDLFNSFTGKSEGAETMFNAVYRVAVRKFFQSEDQKETLSNIDKEAQNKVDAQKATADSNHNTNGTTYEEEMKKILTNNGVKNEQELFDKFEYELMSTEFDDQFYDKYLDTLRDGGKIGNETISGYLTEKQPYHVKHILSKVSADANNPTTGTITQDESIKLSNIVKELAKGELTFGTIAKNLSDDNSGDDSSASNFGDLGVMDRDTSYVNEFKLGVYTYEALFGSSTKATASPKLNIPTKYSEAIASVKDPSTKQADDSYVGIGQIPYEAALALSDSSYRYQRVEQEGTTEYTTGYADIVDADGKEVANGNAIMYPRNIIFNKYFNRHNVCVITPNHLPKATSNAQADALSGVQKSADAFKGVYSDTYAALPGFNRTPKNGDTLIDSIKLIDDEGHEDTAKKILRDEDGRVILAVRAGTSGDSGYQGIHFIVVSRSPFIAEEKAAGATESVKLSEYWTTKTPSQDGYPTYTDGTNKPTYVNPINIQAKKYKTRASTVETKIKNYDSANLKTYIYNSLISSQDLKFSTSDQGKAIQATIDSWISSKRAASVSEANQTWENTWRSYTEYVDEQYAERSGEMVGTEYRTKLISETCAIKYTTAGSSTMFTNGGGMCYAKKA